MSLLICFLPASLCVYVCVCVNTFLIFTYSVWDPIIYNVLDATIFIQHSKVVFYVTKRLLKNSTLMAAQYPTT